MTEFNEIDPAYVNAKAYDRGYQDAIKGVTENPFPPSSAEGMEWRDGFGDGTEEWLRTSYDAETDNDEDF